MPLTMRPTGLGYGIDKDRQDYTVYTGGWDIHLRNPRRPGASALVLVVCRSGSDDAFG
jgi:hypothetical protein